MNANEIKPYDSNSKTNLQEVDTIEMKEGRI